MQEQQRRAAGAFADVGELEPVADGRARDRERARVEVASSGGLGVLEDREDGALRIDEDGEAPDIGNVARRAVMTVPPSSVARCAVASASSTAKYTAQ